MATSGRRPAAPVLEAISISPDCVSPDCVSPDCISPDCGRQRGAARALGGGWMPPPTQALVGSIENVALCSLEPG